MRAILDLFRRPEPKAQGLGASRLSRGLVFAVSLLLTAAIGYLRHLTGPEYALSAFYIFPIALSAWLVGIWGGVSISAAGALSWLTADLSIIESFSNPYVPYVNETFRLLVFLFIALLISKMKALVESQKQLARTDPLTGISNRLAFFEFAESAIQHARRFGHPVSILSLDLDNFKSVNDCYGHREGDKLLRLVAGTIRANIRVIDIVARFGGDEFVILLSRTDSDAAFQLGVKLQRKLLALMKQNNWPATASIGVATYEDVQTSIHEMVASADALMYSAKQNGKNLVLRKISDQTKTSSGIH
ncbi:MAG: GGDEF domain-containing protein [Thermodesulfobacteriota bacterium]